MSRPANPDLFTKGTAVIAGPGDCYRYELRRVWDATKHLLVVCMLNPSTADHLKNDPTVLTLIHFAKLWGYGGLLIVNLFALRTSNPAELRLREDRIGRDNGDWLAAACALAAAQDRRLLVAWGNGGDLDDRAEWFCSRATRVYRLELICLGTTNTWKPKHPMARGTHRIPRYQMPITYRAPVTEPA